MLITRPIGSYGNGAALFYTFDDVLLEAVSITARNPDGTGKLSFKLEHKDPLKSYEQVVEKGITETIFLLPPGEFKMTQIIDIDQDGNEVKDLDCTSLAGIATGWAPDKPLDTKGKRA